MTGRDPRGTTAARGYGARHQRERERRLAAYSPLDPCVRCGQALGSDRSRIHLDHTADRSGYLGLSCAACNIAASNAPVRGHGSAAGEGGSRRVRIGLPAPGPLPEDLTAFEVEQARWWRGAPPHMVDAALLASVEAPDAETLALRWERRVPGYKPIYRPAPGEVPGQLALPGVPVVVVT